jgi:glycerol-3-phosphate dehydrogenase
MLLQDEAMYRFPMLNPDGLKGAVVYYDGMHNDTRMNLMIALTAAQHGAAIANHVKVLSVVHDKDGKASGVMVRDEASGAEWTIRARAVVNATGPFADAIRKMDVPESKERIVPAGGVHIILPDHCSPEDHGLIVPETKDGRVLFFLPWEGATLCGTTDSVTDLTMKPQPTEKEINFILEEANRFLNTKVSRHNVKAAWSGIRPLVRDFEAKDTKSFSRNHVVEVSATGMVSVMGGKWTTYRRMAQDALEKLIDTNPLILEKRAVQPSCTLSMQMLGADRAGIVVGQKFDRITITLREKYGFHKDVAEHLLRNYGTRALQVAELGEKNKELRNRMTRRWPFIAGEVVFAMRQEYAVSAVDVIARRLRLAFLDTESSLKVLGTVLDIMQKEAGWSSTRRAAEEADAKEFISTMNRAYVDDDDT